MTNSDLLFFNGLNGASGEYETAPMTANELAQIALNSQQENQGTVNYATAYGIDHKELAQTGWGVIFTASDEKTTAALKEALKPLLDHRRAQAARDTERFYREFTGVDGYRKGDSKNAFLKRHKVGPGAADPKKMPYYLLLVGDPETMPFMFQYQLDVQYAVGRIHFETLEDYHRYAQNVVQAETQLALGRRATFFGVANPDDASTQLSAKSLIPPLAEAIAKPEWAIETLKPEQATKSRLASLLGGGAETPSLLFTASHGMGFPNGDPRQLKHQGALLCQEWPGPKAHKGPIPEDFYFSAEDVSSNANLLGMLAFFFACYGGGTPKSDDYARHRFGAEADIAPHAFLAELPRKLLLQGASAVIAHVERAWDSAFMWDKAGPQLTVFESALKELQDGYPVGSATEYTNGRYAEVATLVSELVERGQTNPDDETLALELANTWTAHNEARSYIVIGDPAARLNLAAPGAAVMERPTLGEIASAPAQAQPIATTERQYTVTVGNARFTVEAADTHEKRTFSTAAELAAFFAQMK